MGGGGGGLEKHREEGKKEMELGDVSVFALLYMKAKKASISFSVYLSSI